MCKNGATCMQHVLTYTCECAEGFTGSNCEEGTKIIKWQIQVHEEGFNGFHGNLRDEVHVADY